MKIKKHQEPYGAILEIEDHLDVDNADCYFYIEAYAESCGIYIKKQDAIKIINHLEKIFNIKGDEDGK